MCLLQSKFGNLFFLPKSCIPGYHSYVVPIRKVPKEKLEEDCVMCYGPLKFALEQPQTSMSPSVANDGVIANTGGFSENTPQQPGSNPESRQEPLMAKAKTCAVTPCKHYFHEGCFFQWVEIRHQCPICRQPLKFYT